VPCRQWAATVAAMTPLDEARDHVFARCGPLPAVEVRLEDAHGLIVAQDVTAAEDVPPFDNTAVDGFAIQAADTNRFADGHAAADALRIIGTMAAGARPEIPVGAGEAMRIMTGAPIPAGADAVVMVEDSITAGDAVRFTRSVEAGDAIRRSGSDVRSGTLVLQRGTRLNPAHIGVLASIGRSRVSVVRRARVAVLSTGDELVRDERALEPGEIRESNARMITGLVAQTGCDVTDLGIVRDDEAALAEVLRDAAGRFDAIVTSGGVSMGDFDVVKAVLSRIADMRWMQIAIKPAKPFAFGLLNGTPVFGLPGNPVSSLVSFELIARPALRRMMGHDVTAERPRLLGIADEAFKRGPDDKTHFVRARGSFESDGRFHVRSTGGQGSHQLASAASANALVVLPDGHGASAGNELEVILLFGD
jgi:molybdopterin molybdotransferase